jgi:hypothetical protein
MDVPRGATRGRAAPAPSASEHRGTPPPPPVNAVVEVADDRRDRDVHSEVSATNTNVANSTPSRVFPSPDM